MRTTDTRGRFRSNGPGGSFTRSSLGTDLDGGYALAGYHIGRFTPFLMYAHLSHKSRTEIAPVETGSLPTGGQKVIRG